MAESEVFAPSEGIVVLGMHRSGTSAFAGTLHLLGFDFGDDLLKGNQFNRGGYWENRAIVRLNDRLLNSLGAGWSDVQIAPYCSPDLQREFGSEARALLERTFSGKKNWALKDPRLCLLMDFWREIFAEQNISFIHIVRDPLAAAASLYRRDRFPIERGLLLWLSQNLNAEFFTRGYRRCFVNYEDFTTDWQWSLSVAFRQLNIRPRKDFEDAADDIEAFLGMWMQLFLYGWIWRFWWVWIPVLLLPCWIYD